MNPLGPLSSQSSASSSLTPSSDSPPIKRERNESAADRTETRNSIGNISRRQFSQSSASSSSLTPSSASPIKRERNESAADRPETRDSNERPSKRFCFGCFEKQRDSDVPNYFKEVLT